MLPLVLGLVGVCALAPTPGISSSKAVARVTPFLDYDFDEGPKHPTFLMPLMNGGGGPPDNDPFNPGTGNSFSCDDLTPAECTKQRQQYCKKQGKSLCGIKCVSLTSDPKNCGACNTKCEGICKLSKCVKRLVQTYRPADLYALDLRVSGSNRFVLTSCGGQFELYDQAALMNQVTDSILSPKDGLSGLQRVFKGLLYDDTPQNINKGFKSMSPIPCDWKHPWPTSNVNPPAGIVMSPNAFTANKHSDWPSSSCVTDLYDMQQQFDPKRQRFWIVTHVRNRIWTSSCDVAKSSDKTKCQNMNNQARRITLVAVSKTSDPHDGFWTYVANRDYQDQPWQGIHNDYAIFHHNSGKGVYLFDANTMAGTATKMGSATPLKVTNAQNNNQLTAEADFEGVNLRVCKHHEDTGTATVMTSVRGTGDLWIYAFQSPHAAGQTTLLGPAHVSSSVPMGIQECVYMKGVLYIVYTTANHGLQVKKIPASLSAIKSKKQIASSSIGQYSISPPSSRIYDLATIEVTAHDDVFVGFRSRSVTNSTPNLAQYSILYKGEAAFRPVSSLVALTGTKTTVGPAQLDFVSSQRDSYQTASVWSLLADEKGVLLSFVQP